MPVCTGGTPHISASGSYGRLGWFALASTVPLAEPIMAATPPNFKKSLLENLLFICTSKNIDKFDLM
jgi:hypothetical protein